MGRGLGRLGRRKGVGWEGLEAEMGVFIEGKGEGYGVVIGGVWWRGKRKGPAGRIGLTAGPVPVWVLTLWVFGFNRCRFR